MVQGRPFAKSVPRRGAGTLLTHRQRGSPRPSLSTTRELGDARMLLDSEHAVQVYRFLVSFWEPIGVKKNRGWRKLSEYRQTGLGWEGFILVIMREFLWSPAASALQLVGRRGEALS